MSLSTIRTEIPMGRPQKKWWICSPKLWPRVWNPSPRPLPPRQPRPLPKIHPPPQPESRGKFSSRRNEHRSWWIDFLQTNRELAKDAGLSMLLQPVIRRRIHGLQLLQFVADALSLQSESRHFLAALSPCNQGSLRLLQKSLVVRTDGGVKGKFIHFFPLIFFRSSRVQSG